jgi:predicted glycosyltransferase
MTKVVLATSNGTGMGHLTRQAAVAMAMGTEHHPTLFSLSVGLPLATGLGISGEYCPSYDQPWVTGRAWHGYLRDRLVAFVEETDAEVVLFDGVAVYPGLSAARSALRDVAFIWLRRGMWRQQTNEAQIRRSSFFDLVIEPGDLAGDSDHGPTADQQKVTRVSPISLLEMIEPRSREEARAKLGLPLDREIALVTLGSGRLGDVAGPGEVTMKTLIEESDFHVAITRPAVARNAIEVMSADRVSEIRDVYPQVGFLNAFDLAVSSAGYNAVHELIPAGVPSLFVANTSTRTDDQEARAARLERLGLGLQAPDIDPVAIGAALRRLLDDGVRQDIAARAAATRPMIKGAVETAALTLKLGEGFTRRRRRPGVVISQEIQNAKESVKSALGEERTNGLKRLLGREASPIGSKVHVRLVQTPQPSTGLDPVPLAVTESLRREDLDLGTPIEHLLPGSSEGYRERRVELIETYYDLEP